jgi:hypothetical protein
MRCFAKYQKRVFREVPHRTFNKGRRRKDGKDEFKVKTNCFGARFGVLTNHATPCGIACPRQANEMADGLYVSSGHRI